MKTSGTSEQGLEAIIVASLVEEAGSANLCPSRNKGFLIALSGVAFLALPPS